MKYLPLLFLLAACGDDPRSHPQPPDPVDTTPIPPPRCYTASDCEIPKVPCRPCDDAGTATSCPGVACVQYYCYEAWSTCRSTGR